MKNDIEIALATVDDYKAIADIYNEYIELGGSNMEESVYTIERIKDWVDHFSDKERLYAIREDRILIGWGIIKKYSKREGYRFACETAIYITKAKLRKGIGSRMKVFLIDQCQVLGYHHLVAKIFATNIASIEYNLKLGYTIVGRQKEIGFKDGKWVDMIIMQYLINQD